MQLSSKPETLFLEEHDLGEPHDENYEESGENNESQWVG
jgi:hypothetical protein